MWIRYLLAAEPDGARQINGVFPGAKQPVYPADLFGMMEIDETVNAELAADLLAHPGAYKVKLDAQQKPELWRDPDWSDPNAT